MVNLQTSQERPMNISIALPQSSSQGVVSAVLTRLKGLVSAPTDREGIGSPPYRLPAGGGGPHQLPRGPGERMPPAPPPAAGRPPPAAAAVAPGEADGVE